MTNHFEWYNTKICKNKCKEFSEKYHFTYSAVFHALHGSFEDFCLACNALAYYGYLSEEENNRMSFDEKNQLVEIANKIAREKIGKNFSTLFDGVVKESGQELYGGDEFYKLFAYDIPPYYVMSCVKASIYIIDMMNDYIEASEAIKISKMCYHPPYWELYNNYHNNDIMQQNIVREKECKGWQFIAKNLYEQNFETVYEFISKCDEFLL